MLLRVPYEDVIANGAEYLRIVSWGFVAYGLSSTSSSMFQAVGNTLPSLVCSALRLLLCAVAACGFRGRPAFSCAGSGTVRSAGVMQCALNLALFRGAAMHVVVVVDKMTIEIAIRNVTVRDARNNPAFHAGKPCDPMKRAQRDERRLGPRTSMIFDLVSAKDAIIGMQDKATRVELSKGFGLNDPDSAVFPPEVSPEKMEAVFGKHKVSGAHLIFFLVDKLNNSDSGFALPSGMAFIAGTHGPTTFAHEAGHFLGGSGSGKGA